MNDSDSVDKRHTLYYIPGMKRHAWSERKNRQLKRDRGISFEKIIASIESGNLLDITGNPNTGYVDQKVYIVDIDGYAVLVPYVESEEEIFLKTIIPSRKATKKFFGGPS